MPIASDSPFDSLREECGIVGIWEPAQSFNLPDYLVLGLTELQHRGQESAGIAVCRDGVIESRIGMGKVREVFPAGTGIPNAPVGIGHVRYSTTGSSSVQNAGPFIVGEQASRIALAHNGNISNSAELAPQLSGVTLESTTDSEIVAQMLLSAPGQSMEAKLRHVMPKFQGAYSFVILSGGKLYGLRDPYGMRPLCFGRLGRGWILASESSAIEKLGGIYERDIRPGEMIEVGPDGLRSVQLAEEPRRAFCVFEYIYFAGASSSFSERSVYATRQALGRKLAQEAPVPDADLVAGVPDSAVPAAIAFAAESGLPYGEVFIKSRYTDRSFIKPDQRLRQLEVDLKFSIIRHNVEGKRLVLVDDSIVRGNTMKRAITALRNYGAKEVHLRISSPPLRNPCFYGIDINSDEHLIAAHKNVQGIASYIGADSLSYLSLQGLADSFGCGTPDENLREFHNSHCYGCFDAAGYPDKPAKVQPVAFDLAVS